MITKGLGTSRLVTRGWGVVVSTLTKNIVNIKLVLKRMVSIGFR
jgi:hypothetical protein